MEVKLKKENFIEYCISKYYNPHVLSIEEFENDLKTTRYIKAQFRKYIANDDLKVDILLNHFIYIYNCFGDSIYEICFYDFEDYYFTLLKTVFIFLDIHQNKNIKIENKNISFDDILVDYGFLEKLKQSKHYYKCQ